MRTVPGDFKNQSLSYSSQTLCNVAKIELVDGSDTIFYFTDHDRDIRAGDIVYSSQWGFNGSAVQLALGLSGETQTITFLVSDQDSDGGISRPLIFRGGLDQAKVTVSWIDWESPTGGKLDIYCGYLTGISFGEFDTATCSVQSVLGQALNLCTDKYSQNCRYVFGDPNTCGVDITPTQDGPGVYQVIDAQTVKMTADELSAEGYYNNGTCAFLTGPLKDVVVEIAFNYLDTDGRYIFVFKVPLSDTPNSTQAGDSKANSLVLLTAGCDKIVSSGCTYWNNVGRFGGEPFVPSQSIVASNSPPATQTTTPQVVTAPAATTATASPTTSTSGATDPTGILTIGGSIVSASTS